MTKSCYLPAITHSPTSSFESTRRERAELLGEVSRRRAFGSNSKSMQQFTPWLYEVGPQKCVLKN